MGDEGIGEGLTWESGAAREGLEGLPGLVGVARQERFLEVCFQRIHVV